MGLLRNRGRVDGTRYRMREKVFSIGDDFWIESDHDRHAFKVDGKALRIRKTLVVQSAKGDELFTVKERMLSIRDKMTIERDGSSVATVKKRLIGIRERYIIDLEGGGEMHTKGNMVDHEYEVERDGRKIAEVSKRWFRVRDTYGIEIAPGQDDIVVLAVAVAVDAMANGAG